MSAFAEEWWDWQTRKTQWEDSFCELLNEGEDFDDLGTDPYDASLEIYGATNDWRLSEQQQRFLYNSGFGKVYVNHKDGWQTHYNLNGLCLPVRGWRRRYVVDPQAETTRVLSGPEENGFYEISFWPEGWDSPGCAKWLEDGYMRIVPDPLDPFSDPTPTKRRSE